MLKQALYTGIGAAALTVDFVTHPKQSRDWLKKAERRGGKIATRGQARLSKLGKNAGSTVEELRSSSLSSLGLARTKTPVAQSTAPRPAAKPRPARRTAPRRRSPQPAAPTPLAIQAAS